MKIQKDPRALTPAQINLELRALQQADHVLNEEMIDSGRGTERIQETLRKDDPLALRMRELFDRRSALRSEIERRWGPGQSWALNRQGFEARVHASGARLTPRTAADALLPEAPVASGTSQEALFAHLEAGGTLWATAAYGNTARIDKKVLDRFRKAGGWLLKPRDSGFQMQTGRTSVYLLPGVLVARH